MCWLNSPNLEAYLVLSFTNIIITWKLGDSGDSGCCDSQYSLRIRYSAPTFYTSPINVKSEKDLSTTLKMESEHCEVIYLDERAQCERTVEGEQPIAFKSPFGPAPSADEKAADVPPFGGDIDAGVQAMLTSFPRGEL